MVFVVLKNSWLTTKAVTTLKINQLVLASVGGVERSETHHFSMDRHDNHFINYKVTVGFASLYPPYNSTFNPCYAGYKL
jgi:hypothetical protein